MSKVKVILPKVISNAIDGEGKVEVSAKTVAEVLDELVSKYGESMRKKLFDVSGKPRRLLNFYVNGRNIRFLNQLNTELEDGDEVSIIPAVSGGFCFEGGD